MAFSRPADNKSATSFVGSGVFISVVPINAMR
jgi:hypothetical protein